MFVNQLLLPQPLAFSFYPGFAGGEASVIILRLWVICTSTFAKFIYIMGGTLWFWPIVRLKAELALLPQFTDEKAEAQRD